MSIWTNSNITNTWLAIVSNSSGNIIYSLTTNGNLYKSINGGETWTIVYTLISITTAQMCCDSTGQYIFILLFNNNLIYYSNSYGVTFTNTGQFFRYIAISETSGVPTLLAVYVQQYLYYNVNPDANLAAFPSILVNSSSSRTKSFNGISCGSNVSGSTGNIYLNDNNELILNSTNGYNGTFNSITQSSTQLRTPFGNNNIVYSWDGLNFIYSTNSGNSFLIYNVGFNINSIIASSDLSRVYISALGSENIWRSITGPTGEYTITSGSNNGISYLLNGSDDLSIIVAAPTTGFSLYTNDIVCYLKGSLIKTINGYIKIEDLKVGDYILSFGNIINDKYIEKKKKYNSKIKWIGKNEELINEYTYPICIKKDSLEKNIPNNDLYISQKHRILFNNKFICVNQLLNENIFIDKNIKNIEYYHVELENHSIIKVNNIYTESFNNYPINRKYKLNSI